MSTFIIKQGTKLYARSKVLWVTYKNETTEARCPVHTEEKVGLVDAEPDDYMYFCPLCEIERLRTERDRAVEKVNRLLVPLVTEVERLCDGLKSLIAGLANYAPGGPANLGKDEWSGVGIADLGDLRKRLVALLEGEAPAATGQGR